MRTLPLLLCLSVVTACVSGASPGGVGSGAPSRIVPVALVTQTGTQCQGLVARPDTILTVAHCLDERDDFVSVRFADPTIPSQVTRRFAANPAYDRGAGNLTQIDTARLRIAPVGVGSVPFLRRPLLSGEGAQVVVVERNGTRTVNCLIIGQTGQMFELNCPVRDGWSGAPVFVGEGAGRRLAGLVSGRSRGRQSGITVAVGAEILAESLDAVFLR